MKLVVSCGNQLIHRSSVRKGQKEIICRVNKIVGVRAMREIYHHTIQSLPNLLGCNATNHLSLAFTFVRCQLNYNGVLVSLVH